MSIHLIIKGPLAVAQAAMAARGVKPIELSSFGAVGETRAVVSDCHLGAVVEWFAEEPAHAPFPEGTLLLFTHA